MCELRRILIVFLSIAAVSCEFPAEVPRCRHEDHICLTKATQDVVRQFSKEGIPAINLIPFDPLRINFLKLNRIPHSPINLELNFTNVDLHGLQHTRLLNFRGLDKEIKKITEIELRIPKLTLKGPYEVDGNVMMLPITGKGEANIVLDDNHVMLKFKPKPLRKAAEIFMRVEAIKMLIRSKHVTFNLSGLFHGNKELSDTMHEFINENWEVIFTEVEPEMSKALAFIVKDLVNNVFKKYPYNDFFLND